MCLVKDKNTDAVDNDYLSCVVKIECGRNQGTAVCVHSSNSIGLIFLTCAHVVQHKIQSVILRHEGRVFRGRVIYATRKNVPHDVAVIVCEQIIHFKPCPISNKVPTIGQEVFAVGYVFDENVPTSVLGYVNTMSSNILTTTCDVHSGFSGGPVFTKDKKLLGLTIGKLSVGTVNFVLPSSKFMDTIVKYVRTNNLGVLENLESKCQWKKIIRNNEILHVKLCHL